MINSFGFNFSRFEISKIIADKSSSFLFSEILSNGFEKALSRYFFKSNAAL
ncbi:hypothetical protein D3C85_573350 [compost metagenome]